MYKLLFILVSAFAISASAATLKVPENFVVVSLNDQEHSSSFFSRETTLDIPIGEHTLLLKYQDLFEGDDDHTNVKSKPFVVLFSITANLEHQQLTLTEAQVIDDVAQAKKFAKKPNVKLLANEGKKIPSNSQSLLAFTSKQKFKEMKQIKHIPDKVESTCDTEHNQNDLSQLKCIWIQSTKEDQEAFVYFILSQRKSANN